MGRSVARLPYRPPMPNDHWLAGESARVERLARTDCPLSYPGSRWEWEAGWDYADAAIRMVLEVTADV